METEHAKGRTWNGYVCPGCRNVFRVAADFAGDEVMCPSCQETLRLPKKPGDTPPLSTSIQLTPPATEPQLDEDQTQGDAAEPAWRMLFTSPAGRKKLSLALGIPLLLVAIVLMLLPADETPRGQASPAPPPVLPVAPAAPETLAPLPTPDASQIADLMPEVLESEPLPEPPPPALPARSDPAPVAEVPDEPGTSPPASPVPQPKDPEHGLVEAIPATSPATPPPVEMPATPGGTDQAAVTIHTVVRGDTLTKISEAYRVSIREIRQANQLKSDIVQLGQQLRIPGAAPLQSAKPATEEKSRPAAIRHHTVVRGDTLTRIARKYAVDPKAIMRANGMKNDIVRLGAKLVIPPATP